MAKTYTTVPDKAVRDQFSEAMWDTHLRDNINNLILPPSCRATHSTTQTLTTSVETTKAWDTETWDTDGMHDTATNNDRITPTTAGVYVVSATVDFAVNATGYRYITIRLQGVATHLAIGLSTPGSAAIGGWVNASTIYTFNGTTDFVNCGVSQASGGNLGCPSSAGIGSFQAIWCGKSA